MKMKIDKKSRQVKIDWDVDDLADIKKAFPELRNLEGRFLRLFVGELIEKVKEWSSWANKELGERTCDDTFRTTRTKPFLCDKCKYFTIGTNGSYDGGYCKMAPKLGQTWKGDDENTPATLTHPNVGHPYWHIISCPDYKYEKKKPIKLEMPTTKEMCEDDIWEL